MDWWCMDKKNYMDYICKLGWAEIPDLQSKFNLKYSEAKKLVNELVADKVLDLDEGIRYKVIKCETKNSVQVKEGNAFKKEDVDFTRLEGHMSGLFDDEEDDEDDAFFDTDAMFDDMFDDDDLFDDEEDDDDEDEEEDGDGYYKAVSERRARTSEISEELDRIRLSLEETKKRILEKRVQDATFEKLREQMQQNTIQIRRQREVLYYRSKSLEEFIEIFPLNEPKKDYFEGDTDLARTIHFIMNAYNAKFNYNNGRPDIKFAEQKICKRALPVYTKWNFDDLKDNLIQTIKQKMIDYETKHTAEINSIINQRFCSNLKESQLTEMIRFVFLNMTDKLYEILRK